ESEERDGDVECITERSHSRNHKSRNSNARAEPSQGTVGQMHTTKGQYHRETMYLIKKERKEQE
ncbi:hypothetical protein P7K49_028170, partial [Saguinus oedipus]